MVNSDKGITNLHVLLCVIVDASMPMIRTSGQMWNKDGKHKILAVIPDALMQEFMQLLIL
jgi:monomeric isocitrate dehydrogenase